MNNKKYYFVFLVALMFFLVGAKSVLAKVSTLISCDKLVEESTKAYEECSLTLKVTDSTVKINTVTGKFILNNVTLDESNTKMEKDWYLEKVDDQYQITTTKTELPVGDYTLGKFRFYKVILADKCNVGFQPSGYKLIERKCVEYQGIYYDKDGNIVPKQTYESDCFEKPKICVKEGSDYYGKSGTKVNKSTYEKECETHKCYKYEDGTYAGVNGDIVELDQYNRECNQGKHYCEYVDGTYYDDKGNNTNEATFNYLCKAHYCEVFSTKDLLNVYELYPSGDDDMRYFGIDGNLVTKDEYELDCFKHYCEHIVIRNPYTRPSIFNHWFDKDGNETDEATYNIQCVKHYCEYLNNTYYGIYGDVVQKDQYDKECDKHYCEIINNTYYGKDGSIVDKATYDKYCPIPENPSTGNFIPFIYIGILIAGGVGIYFYTKKKNKLI